MFGRSAQRLAGHLTNALRIRFIANRAAQPGVLQPSTVGVVMHALRSTNELHVTNIGFLSEVLRHCRDADLRSQCNVLHALAFCLREQHDVHEALLDIHNTLLEALQESIEASVGSLTPPECILASEALVQLQPWGCVRPSLSVVLHERTSAVAPFVRRPVDLIGLVRVAVEALFAPTTAGGKTSRAASARVWEDEIEELMETVESHLATFRKQELISLMDAISLSRIVAARSGASAAAQRQAVGMMDADESPRDDEVRCMDGEEPVKGKRVRGVPAPCQRLASKVADRVAAEASHLSAAQVAAWVQRLVDADQATHPAFHAVLLCLVAGVPRHASAPVGETALVAQMTASQLATTGAALSRALQEDISDEASPGTDEGDSRAHVSTASWDSTPPSAGGSSAMYSRQRLFSPSERHRCVSAVTLVLSTLVAHVRDMRRKVGEHRRVPEEPHVDVVRELYRLLYSLPWRCCDPARQDGPGNELIPPALLVECVRELIEKFDALSPRQRSDVVCSVFRMRLYGSAPDTREAPRRGDHLGAREVRGPTPSDVKHLVEKHLECFNVTDVLHMLNELVAATFSDAPVSLPSGCRRDGLTAIEHRSAIDLAEALHMRAQRLKGKSTVHTAILVRYLSSMSKMLVRKKSDYSKVLLILKSRTVTDFELVRILGVAARHHVSAVEFVETARGRLVHLRHSLHPIQKCMLLRYLGQSRSHRVFRVPRHGHLDAFLSPEEVAQLSPLHAAQAIIGLVSLRQHEHDGIPLLVSHLHSQWTAEIRSPALLCELAASLGRLGWVWQGHHSVAMEQLLTDVLMAATDRLPSSRSLFADTVLLATQWAVVSTAVVPEQRAAPPLAAAMRVFERTVVALLEAKILNIATSSSLRPNTFLFSQLATAFLFGANVGGDSPLHRPTGVSGAAGKPFDTLQRLVVNMALGDLVKLSGNPRDVACTAVTALHIAPRFPDEACSMLHFVTGSIGYMSANEVALVCREVALQKDTIASVHGSSKLTAAVAQLDEAARLHIAQGSGSAKMWIRLAPREREVTSLLTGIRVPE